MLGYYLPVPVRETATGLGTVVESPNTWSVPVKETRVAGRKLTDMLQDLPEASVCPMQLPAAKVNVPAGAAVTMFALVKVSAIEPEFLMLRFWVFVVRMVTLEKPTGAGDTVKDDATPVPDNDTAVGLLTALCAIDSVAARAPLAFGEKVTAMLQFAPTASVNG